MGCYHGAMLRSLGRRPAGSSSDEDESRDYLARTLPVILWLTLLGCVAATIVALANAQNQTAAGILASAALTGGSLALVRRGRLRLASGAFLANGLLLAAYLLAVGSGLRDLALLVYPLILVMGGMLLEGAAFGVLLGLCLASLVLGTYGHARLHGGIAPGVQATDLLYVMIILAVTAAAVWLLANALRRSLREARTSERALRASEASFTIAFRSSPVIMVITSIDDARVLDVNDAFSAATGFAREEVVGSLVLDLALFVDAGERDHIRASMLERGAVRGEPLRLRTRSGEQLWTVVGG
jgi:PAS domain S-box-containing protein